MDQKELRAKAYALPLRPGVYQMKDASGNIIYVGKAKKLRNRVSSYFINTGNHGIKTETMLSHVNDFEVIITTTEWEALVLGKYPHQAPYAKVQYPLKGRQGISLYPG